MYTSIQYVVLNVAIVTLSSVSGSIIWNMYRDVYNYQIHNMAIRHKPILEEIKNMIHLNFGTFLGFSISVSYICTGQPVVHNIFEIIHQNR